MKAQRVKIEQDEVFKPFAIQISIESKEEAQALYAMFNYVKNSQMFDSCESVMQAISEEYYVIMDEDIIANGITYDQYYRGDAWNKVEV